MEFGEVMTHTTMLSHLAAAGQQRKCLQGGERERERARAPAWVVRKKQRREQPPTPQLYLPLPRPWGRMDSEVNLQQPQTQLTPLPPIAWALMGVRKKKTPSLLLRKQPQKF